MKGTIVDANQHLLLYLLKLSNNNNNTLYYLHFELLKILKKSDYFVEYISALNNKKLHYIIIHEGNSVSTNKKNT